MPFAREGVYNGGGIGIINATQHDHGPSWRMIVHLTTPTEAYAVYPGGQSGNPGSPYYDDFIDTWAKGEYYALWFMQAGEERDRRVKWTMTFKP
jgi:penicillin amidase